MLSYTIIMIATNEAGNKIKKHQTDAINVRPGNGSGLSLSGCVALLGTEMLEASEESTQSSRKVSSQPWGPKWPLSS